MNFVLLYFFFISFHKTFCLLADFWGKKTKKNANRLKRVHKLSCKFEEIEWKEDETSTREGLHSTSVTKCPTKSRERRAAVHNYYCFGGGGFHFIPSYISDYSHSFCFFLSRKKKPARIRFAVHTAFDTFCICILVAVLFACVSSSPLPIRSWNNFPSQKQQGAAEFSSLSQSHYLRRPTNPFSPSVSHRFFPWLTNIIENVQS